MLRPALLLMKGHDVKDEFEIIRSTRRTVSLEVRTDGTVVVRAPERMPYEDICDFVARHRGWIEKKKESVGRAVPYSYPESDGLKKMTYKIVSKYINYWSGIMGLHPTSVKITDAKTRYGSCSGKDTLCFSTLVAFLPDDAAEYICVHELAHIAEKNHGPRFYALIEKYLPDYRRREALLKGKKKELWDVLGIDGEKTGELAVRGEKLPEGKYHLVVNVCIFDGSGRLLIQRRAREKEHYAGYWDFSACGSALAGEDSIAAAVRETREELGLDIAPDAPVMRLRAEDYFDDYYFIRADVNPDKLTLQREEVAETRYAERDEVYALFDTGAFIPYHAPLIDMIFSLEKRLGPFAPGK